MTLALAIAAICTLPPAPVVIEDRCEVIELNHYHCESSGEHVLSQLIFFIWSDEDERLHVMAWRIFREPMNRPTRDHVHGGWVVMFYDQDLLRIVRARSFCESWTTKDYEVLERKELPAHERQKLTGER